LKTTKKEEKKLRKTSFLTEKKENVVSDAPPTLYYVGRNVVLENV
jgi:hypothetical protein